MDRALAGVKIQEIKSSDQFMNQDQDVIAELL